MNGEEGRRWEREGKSGVEWSGEKIWEAERQGVMGGQEKREEKEKRGKHRGR